MPVFEGPMRDENPIPERESNILSCAFPKLFQTGIGDIYAPQLRALDEDGADAIQAFVHHCLYWKDNRFSKHPRFLYVLYNRMLGQKLLKTKSFYLKQRKPTPADFLPENRKKIIKDMRAYTAKLPTTPGFKLQRRSELDTMCDQIHYMTANTTREERLMVEDEYVEYVSSEDESDDDENTPRPPLFWNQTQSPVSDAPQVSESSQPKEIKKRPIEGRIPAFWATFHFVLLFSLTMSMATMILPKMLK